jgi:hypothetical protein
MFNIEDDGLTVLLSSEIMNQLCGPLDKGDDTWGSKVIRSNKGDFVRQPCKARGVTITAGQKPHVARFAYIDIPLGTKHGTVLSCCHPLCMTSGRRFRYCIHCQTAVAKRNFNVRHAHGSTNLPLITQLQNTGLLSADRSEVKHEAMNIDDKAVPPMILVDEIQSVNTNFDDDQIRKNLILNAHEIEVVNLIRSRPGIDYRDEVEKWKKDLLRLLQVVHQNFKLPNESSSISSEEESKSSRSLTESFRQPSREQSSVPSNGVIPWN